MWPFSRNENEQATSRDSEATAPQAERDEDRGEKLRRRAGCIWSCLTEPVIIVVVSLLAGIFGAAYLARWARRQRERKLREERHRDERS